VDGALARRSLNSVMEGSDESAMGGVSVAGCAGWSAAGSKRSMALAGAACCMAGMVDSFELGARQG